MNRATSRGVGENGEPLVSVVTVNYNGAHLLGDLLDSLQRQSWQNREIIVVDNGSTDGSLELLSRDYPQVRVLRQSENAGFAGGNNAGIRAARGELVALINNDTVADARWLEELVGTVLEDPDVAAAGSKILFFRPFLPIRLTVESPSSPPRKGGGETGGGGVLFGEETTFAGCTYHKPIFKEGFSGPELMAGRPVRRTAGEATVYLPIHRLGQNARLLLLASWGDAGRGRRLRVDIGSTRAAEVDLDAELREHPVDVPAAVVRAEAFDVINNAGTALAATGDAADRGIYEPDRGQYDREEDVEAVCGAAALFRRSALDRVGVFDRDFFLYYEDTDLSWRLRAKGYRLRYQPQSTIRHLHASSTVEWSPLFNFYTARNKILMIVKNGGSRAFLRAYGEELRCILGIVRRLWRGRRGSMGAQARQELATRLRVHMSLLGQIPRALLKRAGLIAH